MRPPERERHRDDGTGRPADVLVWRFDGPVPVISSAVLGGGLGTARWVLNAQVDLHYGRLDPEAHLTEIADQRALEETGVGLMTAARVDRVVRAEEGGVVVDATVGLSVPTWAAAADAEREVGPPRPGTINLVAWIPVRLSEAALVNAVITATEAKTQALLEAGVPGTGTASDAVVIACRPDGPAECFGGPRSAWGARLARAVHAAVGAGTADHLRRSAAGSW